MRLWKGGGWAQGTGRGCSRHPLQSEGANCRWNPCAQDRRPYFLEEAAALPPLPAESVSADSGWEPLASQGWWASSVLLMLQVSVASHMQAGNKAKVGKGQPCLSNTDRVPGTVHEVPEFFLWQSYGIFAHSQRQASVRGGIWIQISLPPTSFSHWIPCLIPKVPSNNTISTWKNSLMREYTPHRWRVKQRGSAQEAGTNGNRCCRGHWCSATRHLLLQLCLQLADELILALQGFQQLLVLLVQAAWWVHIVQIG